MSPENTDGRPRPSPGRAFGPRRGSFWLIVALPPMLVFAGVVFPALPGPRWLEPLVSFTRYLSFYMLFAPVVYPAGAIIAAVAAAVAPRHVRKGRLWLAAAFALGCVGLIPALLACQELRMQSFRLAARKAVPVIQALETHRERRGVYPSSFSDLVPEYLPAVPETGMIGYPDFRYQSGEEADGRAGGCVLYVLCGWGGGFDSFHYWPSQDYPDKMWGGVVERIDSWAYVHE